MINQSEELVIAHDNKKGGGTLNGHFKTVKTLGKRRNDIFIQKY